MEGIKVASREPPETKENKVKLRKGVITNFISSIKWLERADIHLIVI